MCSNFGKTSIRSLENFDKKVGTLKDSKQLSEVARYSPDETMLAVGSHDDHVYVYKINEAGEYHLFHKFMAGSSFINALDWSKDGNFVRTTNGAHELLFFNINEKKNHDSQDHVHEWAS